MNWIAALILAVLFGGTGAFDVREGLYGQATVHLGIAAIFGIASVLLGLGVTL